MKHFVPTNVKFLWKEQTPKKVCNTLLIGVRLTYCNIQNKTYNALKKRMIYFSFILQFSGKWLMRQLPLMGPSREITDQNFAGKRKHTQTGLLREVLLGDYWHNGGNVEKKLTRKSTQHSIVSNGVREIGGGGRSPGTLSNPRFEGTRGGSSY